MARFTDYQGQEWELRLTVGGAADVKRDTGVNLAIASRDASWVEAVFGADGKLAEVLWVLCERQARERGVEPEAFAHRLDGDTLDRAGAALAEAIADFFPRSAVAKALKAKLTAVMAEADRRAVAAIENLSTDSPSPTSVPESSGATPAG